MGELNIFDLSKFIDAYGCKTYVETGTGIGVCLSHAIKYNFDNFFSIDLDGELIESAKKKFDKSNIHFFHNYSTEALKEIVPILDTSIPTLFFLDAHFPGADFNKLTYEESIRQFKTDAFPLLEEIKIIKNLRNISKDVFIIDDWKLYDETKNYEHPGWDYKSLQIELNLTTKDDDILNEFKNTHNYFINLRHQGFLIVTPKEVI